MKIIYFTHSLPKNSIDRTTIFTRELACAFKEAGHDLRVVVPYHPELDLVYHATFYTIKAFHYFPIKKFERIGYGKGMSDGKRQSIRNIFLGPFYIVAGIIAVIRESVLFKPDLIFSNWGIPDGVLAAFAGGLFNIPTIITYIGADVKMISSNVVFANVAKMAADRAIMLGTNSNDLKNELINSGFKKTISLIVYGADQKQFYPDTELRSTFRRHYGIGDEILLVGSIGRFIDKKGFEYLVEAAHILEMSEENNSVMYVLFGDGENMPQIKSMISQYKLEKKFLLPGPLPYSELPKLYNGLDLFVNPAVRNPPDGLNVVVVEAMACGKPIIGTNVCGNELVIQDGENGFLVKEKNGEELARVIKVLSTDTTLCQRMGKSSRELFLSHYTWGHLVAQCEDALKGANV